MKKEIKLRLRDKLFAGAAFVAIAVLILPVVTILVVTAPLRKGEDEK